ncbi:MAG: FAD-dependent monooxygenase, partial [Chloroflexi bacterium]|nr:FAD-dependent monooxygenase [Chloroflexota bacterium]
DDAGARVLARASCTEEVLDVWRTPDTAFPRQWEERFGASVMLPLLKGTLAHALEDAGVTPEAIKTLIVDSTNPRVNRTLPAAAGFQKEQVADDLSSSVGRAGVAHAGLLLASVLDTAEPGDLIAIVVGADGRNSMVRKWGGFVPVHDPDRLLIAGVLLDGVEADTDTMLLTNYPMINSRALLFPQRDGRARSYIVRHVDDDQRYDGEADLADYFEDVIKTGASPDIYAKATASGPLATFNGADSWVPHPFKDGVALIGDAAAISDPSWGQGLSLTLHDVRLLRDTLLESDDWDAAGHAYAQAHDRDFAITHETEDWFARILAESGPEAQELQARVLPLMMQDPDYLPDTFQSGPEHVTLDEERKREIFGD